MKIMRIVGIGRNDSDGSLTIACETDIGEQLITVPRSQVESILNGISGMPVPKSGQHVDYGTIRPSSIQPFQDPDGTIGLCVFLGESVALPIAFPRETIPALRQNIDEMELLGTPHQGSA